MKHILAFFALISAFGTPVQAAEDRTPRTGSHISREEQWEAYSVPETRQVEVRFAACVLKKHRSEAKQYVLGIEDVEMTRKLVEKVADGDCLLNASRASEWSSAVSMHFPGDLMKYTLADALIRSELPTGPIADLQKVAPLSHTGLDPARLWSDRRWKDEAIQKAREERQVYDQVSQFGECIVRADVADSYALFLTSPSSREEAAVFGRLGPALADCLGGGQTIAFQKATLRGTIALNYYRLALAPRVQQAAEGSSI